MNERQIHVLGAKIDLFTSQEVFAALRRFLRERRAAGPRHLVTLNPEIALLCERVENFQKVINRGDITVADGVGLRLAARLLGESVPPRITGRDVVDMLCRLAVESNVGVYLAGGRPEIAKNAAEALVARYPGLRVVGAEEGISEGEFVPDGEPARALAKRINDAGAAIVLVAFGAPKQEQWIAAQARRLPKAKIAVGVGGIFDYLAGSVRAPGAFWQKSGLEWLFRLLTQPWRFRRIWNATAVFLSRVAVWKFRIRYVWRNNAVACILDKDRRRSMLVTPWWSKDERWQFPQGGIDRGESPEHAVLREMGEELGTMSFRVLKHLPRAHSYEWPRWYQFVKGYKGQRQDVFILEFTGQESDISLESAGELQRWKWVPLAEMIDELAQPRREVGNIALQAVQTLIK